MTRCIVRCVLGGIAFVFAFWLLTQVAEARDTSAMPDPGTPLTIDPTPQGRRGDDGPRHSKPERPEHRSGKKHGTKPSPDGTAPPQAKPDPNARPEPKAEPKPKAKASPWPMPGSDPGPPPAAEPEPKTEPTPPEAP